MTDSQLPNITYRLKGRWRGLSALWRIQIIGWGLFFCLELLVLSMVYRDIGIALGMTLALVPLLMLLVLGLGRAYARLGFAGRITSAALFWIFSLSLAASGVITTAGMLVRLPFGLEFPYWAPLQDVMIPLFYYWMIFICWSLAYFWVEAELARRAERQRAARAEAETLRTELQRLRLQLDPHFLLNALNGIGEELHDHPAAAQAMLADLSTFLQQSLAGSTVAVVPLGDEVAALSAYLRVQQSRFGPRLTTEVDVEHGLSGRPIPSFLLQPLVENAFKHGDRRQGVTISVRIRANAGALHILIRNTGRLANALGTTHGGIGLTNLRHRLALHYPNRHHFALREEAGSVVAELTLEGTP